MNKRITYRNRVEIKIISIFYAIVFCGLFIYTLISDIVSNNELNLEKLLNLLLVSLPFLVILWIIARYKIVFDFNKNEIIYVYYFNFKRIYKFSDVSAHLVFGKTTLPNDYTFNFICNDKVIFTLSSFDFEFQTKEKVDLLKEFFTGNSKFIYELEKEIKKLGIDIIICSYELIDVIGGLYFADKNISIKFGYSTDSNCFMINVCKCIWDKNFVPKSILMENLNVKKENLLSLLIQYYEKYK